jgi:hypothetical protein
MVEAVYVFHPILELWEVRRSLEICLHHPIYFCLNGSYKLLFKKPKYYFIQIKWLRKAFKFEKTIFF